jgi:hypothetical protein
MFLELHIDGIFIDRQLVNFEYCFTVTDREEYLHSLRAMFERKHKGKIRRCAKPPQYFIDHVPSRVNFMAVDLRVRDWPREA